MHDAEIVHGTICQAFHEAITFVLSMFAFVHASNFRYNPRRTVHQIGVLSFVFICIPVSTAALLNVDQ